MNVMKFCPECYKELPPNAATCPFCGYKTGNGDPEDDFQPPLQKQAVASGSIPLEQTILGMLVLLLCFWGLSIAATLVPVFINPLYMDQLLLAAVISQVVLRLPIGVWALEEQSFHKDLSLQKKIGTFLLAFIPLGALVTFLFAAKSTMRRDRFSEVSIGTLGAVALAAVLLYSTMDTVMQNPLLDETSIVSAASTAPNLDNTSAETSSLEEGPSEESASDSDQSTSSEVALVDPNCNDPSSITLDDEGRNLTVCGRVTNYGDIYCDTCPNGYYSFIKLDGSFQIVSYDWRFTFAWLGDCLKVADDVETLGENPVFVFGRGEGFAGTECITDAQGELVCEGGMYFQDYFGCTTPRD